MKKQIITLGIILLGAALFTSTANAQVTNSISGNVFVDGNNNGVLDAPLGLVSDDKNMAGIFVQLYPASYPNGLGNDTLLAGAFTDANGNYTLKSYSGNGNYKVVFTYPSTGLAVETMPGNTDVQSISITSPIPVININLILKPLQTYVVIGGAIDTIRTVTYCASKDYATASWTDSLQLPYYNSAMFGPIYGVSVYAGVSTKIDSFGYENLANQPIVIANPDDRQMKFLADITVAAPAVGIINNVVNTSHVLQIPNNFPAYDGISDYAGASGILQTNKTFGAFKQLGSTISTPSANIYDYSGSGATDFKIGYTAAISYSAFVGSSSQTLTIAKATGATCVVYQYNKSSALPVTFTSFDVKKSDNKVLINWGTAMEFNNKGYSVEKSTDGKNFQEIEFIPTKATNGRSAFPLNYTTTDNYPQDGQNFYRIKQIDDNNKIVYSNIKSVIFGAASTINIFPNPASDIVTISNVDNESITVFDNFGREVKTPFSKSEGQYILNVSHLASGIYNIEVKGATTVSYKLVVRR